jgi:hypothetical protein
MNQHIVTVEFGKTYDRGNREQDLFKMPILVYRIHIKFTWLDS